MSIYATVKQFYSYCVVLNMIYQRAARLATLKLYRDWKKICIAQPG
jgi:hypothetical protein